MRENYFFNCTFFHRNLRNSPLTDYIDLPMKFSPGLLLAWDIAYDVVVHRNFYKIIEDLQVDFLDIPSIFKKSILKFIA